VFPADGGEPVDIPLPPERVRFIASSWSGDGGRIAGGLLGATGPPAAIYSFATRSWTRLAGSLDQEWMPDGRHLLMARRDGIFRVDPDTGAETVVLRRPLRSTQDRGALALSRDGRRALFSESGPESDLWTTELPRP
jgi:hypothetical protein